MLMMDKPLVIVILMYCLSFSLLVGQWVLGDVFNVTMTNFQGVPVKSDILALINTGQINFFQSNVTNTSQASIVANTIGITASMAWELVQLLTGTYIFNLMYLFGVPAIAVIGIVIVYVVMLMRMVLGYVRGI